MLESQTIKKIEAFVYSKPRSIQEIAKHIDKSWRTTYRYIEEIEKDYGTIASRTFREGTRGALKIVYWASIEKVSSSVFQETLEKEIETFKRKEDFFAFDIYQHVEDRFKKASIEQVDDENRTNLAEFKEYIEKTERQLLFFSGNLSWLELKNRKVSIFDEIERLVKRGVSIKILSRVDVVALSNIKKILSLNFKYGKELVEVRHAEQPLRALVVDGKAMRLKEVRKPADMDRELKKKIFIFYNITDPDWVEWLSRIFWKIFAQSIDANKRLKEIDKLKH